MKMSTAVHSFLRSFETWPEIEKHELAFEILKRSVQFNFPPLSDEELVLNAETLFLELDRREAKNGKPQSRRSVAR